MSRVVASFFDAGKDLINDDSAMSGKMCALRGREIWYSEHPAEGESIEM